MSVKVYFLHSHLSYSLENLGVLSEEQGECFHKDTKTNGTIPRTIEHQHDGRLLLVPHARLQQ